MESSVSDAKRQAWRAAGAVCGVVLVVTALVVAQLPADTEAQPVAAHATPTASPTPTEPALRTSGWMLSWSDEFNGKGVPARWTPVIGDGTNGDHALSYYQAGNNMEDGQGHLVITAAKASAWTKLRCGNGPCKYVSGRLHTTGTFSQAYGRFEARMKLPVGNGTRPAFRLQSDDPSHAEIDVLEARGGEPARAYGFARVPSGHGAQPTGGGSVQLTAPLSGAYHVYGVDWTPRNIVWWVDAKPYGQLRRSRNWAFGKPFHLILDVQVGGGWAGSPNSTTAFPTALSVDWVRVYHKK